MSYEARGRIVRKRHRFLMYQAEWDIQNLNNECVLSLYHEKKMGRAILSRH
jgi:hypothetical protein